MWFVFLLVAPVPCLARLDRVVCATQPRGRGCIHTSTFVSGSLAWRSSGGRWCLLRHEVDMGASGLVSWHKELASPEQNNRVSGNLREDAGFNHTHSSIGRAHHGNYAPKRVYQQRRVWRTFPFNLHLTHGISSLSIALFGRLELRAEVL